MFCSPQIASWENLMSVSTLVTTYEDLWSVGTCDERSQGPIALPIQEQITHTMATFYTTGDYGALYFRWYRIEATQ